MVVTIPMLRQESYTKFYPLHELNDWFFSCMETYLYETNTRSGMEKYAGVSKKSKIPLTKFYPQKVLTP